MAGAYREAPAPPAFPARQIAWRRRVARGALLLVISVFAKWAGIIALAQVDASSRVVTVATILLQLGVCAATWMVTTAPPPRRPGTLAWLLRGGVVAELLCWAPIAFGVYPARLEALAILVVACGGLLYLGQLFGDIQLPRRALQARGLAVGVVAPVVLMLLLPPRGFKPVLVLCVLAELAALLLSFLLLVALRIALHVKHSELWLDDRATPPEWVSLFVLGDGRAEVFSTRERYGYFATRLEAEIWLGLRMVTAADAVERRLVAAPR